MASNDLRARRSREAILAGARALLIEEGWEAVTQERVALRAGVARATVYRHWPDRVPLLIEAIEPFAATMHGARTGELRADLVAELNRFQEAIWQPSLHKLLAALAYYGTSDPDIEDARVRLVSIHDGFVRNTVRSAVQAGELDPSVSPAAAAAQLIGPISYRILLSGEPTPPEFVEELVDRFIAGCSRVVGPSSPRWPIK